MLLLFINYVSIGIYYGIITYLLDEINQNNHMNENINFNNNIIKIE